MKTFLPIGSVVQLHEAEKSLMIIGTLQTTDDGREFDYIACVFPEGYIDEDTFFLFNNEDIETVHFVGHVNAESQAYNMMIGSDEFKELVEEAIKEDTDESDENSEEESITAEEEAESEPAQLGEDDIIQ